MWYVYGTVAIVLALIFLTGMALDKKVKQDPFVFTIFLLIALVCLLAGLDWWNLIPEV